MAGQNESNEHMSTITMKDDTQIFHRDWGSGQPVVFSQGWRKVALVTEACLTIDGGFAA